MAREAMATARYRLVHFVPDPFVGARVPVAAVLEADGRTSVHRLPHLPGPECLGGKERATALHMVLEGLGELASFERLPVALGPQALLDDAREVPRGVDAQAWLEDALLRVAPRQPAASNHSGQNRATYGYRFFENWNVQRWVHKTFHPGQSIPGLLVKARPLDAISHYVVGRDEVLLMEPIVPTRAEAKRSEKEGATLFGAYKTAMTPEDSGKAKLVAYVLADGAEADRREIKAMLADWADEVFDTTSAPTRDRLVERVRSVGRSAEPATLA